MAYTTDGLPQQVRNFLSSKSFQYSSLKSGANFRLELVSDISQAVDKQLELERKAEFLQTLLKQFPFDAANSNAQLIVQHDKCSVNGDNAIIKFYAKGFNYPSDNPTTERRRQVRTVNQTDDEFNQGIVDLIDKRYPSNNASKQILDILTDMVKANKENQQYRMLVQLWGEEHAQRMWELHQKVLSGDIQGKVVIENVEPLKKVISKKTPVSNE